MEQDSRLQFASKVGRRIRLAREIRGLTQEDLGICSGLVSQEIGEYEIGIGSITVDELEKVANALCLPIIHFMDTCVLCGNE